MGCLCCTLEREKCRADHAFIAGLAVARAMQEPEVGNAFRRSLCKRHSDKIADLSGVRLVLLAEGVKESCWALQKTQTERDAEARVPRV